MKLRYLLAALLLLPPLHTSAMDNPFKSDPRPAGIVGIGVALVVSGLYLIHKENPAHPVEQFAEGVCAPIFISTGVLAILYANEIIVDFDKLSK